MKYEVVINADLNVSRWGVTDARFLLLTLSKLLHFSLKNINHTEQTWIEKQRRKERDIWSNMADGWGWGRWQELSKASSQC